MKSHLAWCQNIFLLFISQKEFLTISQHASFLPPCVSSFFIMFFGICFDILVINNTHCSDVKQPIDTTKIYSRYGTKFGGEKINKI